MSSKGVLGVLTVGLSALAVSGCGGATDPDLMPGEVLTTTSTPTPTEIIVIPAQPTTEFDPCAGLAGSIEMQVLVGPSEAVGMDRVAVGTIPFTVTEQDGLFVVDGGGPILFEDQVFEAEWGTYTVSFDADNDVTGTCRSAGEGAELAMTIVMEGAQRVSVRADGVQADYPWEGTRTLDVTLPAEDGATESGEGWTVVLRVDG
ncbi:MAG: hypothetical protein ACQERF_12260 [Actinomycetota bacterium]